MTLGRTVFFGALFAVLFAAACTQEEKDIPTAVGGRPSPNPIGNVAADSSTGDGGTSDATSDDGSADGGACLANATFAFDSAYGGNFAIRGRVTFPASLPTGRVVNLSIQAAVGGEAKQQSFATTGITDSATFRIGGLLPAGYVLRVQADANGNGAVGDPGDYDGYYDGTASGPILVRADAVAITVKDACLDNVDFGAGIKL